MGRLLVLRGIRLLQRGRQLMMFPRCRHSRAHQARVGTRMALAVVS
jgi:hypothetical protein